MIKELHATTDPHCRTTVIGVRWWHGGWTKMRVNQDVLEGRVTVRPHVKFQKEQEDPVEALRGNISARTQLHLHRLNQHFPKRVRDVQLERSEAIAEYIVIVQFHNGHVVRRPESEVQTKDFLALCGMLYDLPPKGE